MQCPGCEYTVLGAKTGFPSGTHCCEACAWEPGRHGPRCARHVSFYAERPRVCPGCQRHAVTGVSSTHCCQDCEAQPGEHGHACHRRPPHWSLTEEHAVTLRQRLARSAPSQSSPAASTAATPDLARCAYVALLYGADMEYALGALLVASSLRRAGARARTVLLHTADVPSGSLELLRKVYDDVQLIADPVRVPHDSPLCQRDRDFGHSQFLKLHILELEFEKVLYLDSDVLVRRNLDGLFGLQAPAAMERILPMPPHGAKLPNRVGYRGHCVRGIQGGVMLLAPDAALFASMRQEVEDPEALRESSYEPRAGNEQDYLTWRYCADRLEEDGHPPVWTHLGCEYNYEVHPESMYFSQGRERWLWLDYEREAAVLHFSAPLRKRAKRLLHGGVLASPEAGAQVAAEEEPEPWDTGPLLAFAHRAWDEEVRHLRVAVAGLGEDLGRWLGEGLGAKAHAAAFAVADHGDAGMQLRQLPEGTQPAPGGGCDVLVFEAYTSNCMEGLQSLPPSFSQGPPWGVCFWAWPEWGEQQAEDKEEEKEEETKKEKENNKDKEGEQQQQEAGEEVEGEEDVEEAAGNNQGGEQRASWAAVCRCAELRRPPSRQPASPATDGLEHIGAWLRCARALGPERWAFGLASQPPHLRSCPAWRKVAGFRAKVLHR